MADLDTIARDDDIEFVPQWGDSAPRGGRAVLNRMLREGSKVPLFLGQTFVNSLRDVGYNNTTSAVCEHVDNAIQAGASEIRVYFNQTGRRGKYDVDVAVFDNGPGMPPHVLQVATAFGGSMYYDNRSTIGRFGVGMKTAALSMGPVMELYSWQEPGSIYTMILDVNDISSSGRNSIELPEPLLVDVLPPQLAGILTKLMIFPKDATQQELLARDEDQLAQHLGRSGTIVFIPDCDRLSSKTAKTLVDHATRDMARVYRRQLGEGLRLYINNRRIEAFDPTYWMLNARHTKIEGLSETRSRLVHSWPNIEVPIEEGSKETGTVSAKLYMLPMEAWYDLPRKTLRDLQVFEDHLVSFVRNGREVHIGTVAELSGRRHADAVWMRLQIDFGSDLDEAFGVAMNKQGVRPKKYALDCIREQIREEVSRIREATAEFRAEHTKKGSKSKLSEAERIAKDADAFQARQLPSWAAETEEEKNALEQNLRALAVTLKRHDETDNDAYERIKASSYVTAFKHDEYWPFYHVDFQLGKVILTINTAHPFFTQLYEPLSRIATPQGNDDAGVDDRNTVLGASTDASSVLIALQMLLFSLARAQSQMLSGETAAEHRLLFDNLRREWSNSLKTQLQVAQR